MKKMLLYMMIVAIFAGLLAATAVKAAPTAWTSIVPGIDYQAFTYNSPDPGYAGPVRVYVTRLDRSNTSVTLDSAIANGTISGSRQKVADMAALYDESINYWGQSWGKRNNVVVAINGGYFDLTSGVIQGGQLQDGWYAKRFGDYGGGGGGGGSGFAWTLNRVAFMGQCVYHNPDKQYIEYLRGSPLTVLLHQPLDGNNLNPSDRLPDRLVMYTPQYNKTTPVDAQNTLELTVELNTPALIKPSPSYVTGYVRALQDGHGSSQIPYDSVVLSAAGMARNVIINSGIQVGDEIHITQEITHYLKSDCTTPAPGDWTKTYASIDGNKIVVYDGAVPSNLPVLGPDPRTAIAFNNSFIYYIVVDGRQPGYSIGLDLKYLGQFALNTLGATWAINQDGGGSSTMVINGSLVNLPSDGCPVIYLPLVSRSSAAAQTETPTASFTAPESWKTDMQPQERNECQRPVANGMLMVQVEAVNKSSRFTSGASVITNQAAVLRLGPGSNYAAITTLPAGTAGVILADNNNLGGILAKGSYRWKVDFGGSNAGWVAEETLNNH
jgi:hypothetical protein